MKRVRVTVIAEAEDDVNIERIGDHVAFFAETYNFMVSGLEGVELEQVEEVS